MIMAGSLIKIAGVGVLEAVPGDSISLYEYRKIHQTEIIKWSRWGFLCGCGTKPGDDERCTRRAGRSKHQPCKGRREAAMCPPHARAHQTRCCPPQQGPPVFAYGAPLKCLEKSTLGRRETLNPLNSLIPCSNGI